MTDTVSPAGQPPAGTAALAAVDAAINGEFVAVEAKAKEALIKLHDDWKWIVAHTWSVRFIFAAFLLSALEVFLPLMVGKTSINPVVFAGVIAVITGAAFVARIVAQKKAGVSDG